MKLVVGSRPAAVEDLNQTEGPDLKTPHREGALRARNRKVGLTLGPEAGGGTVFIVPLPIGMDKQIGRYLA